MAARFSTGLVNIWLGGTGEGSLQDLLDYGVMAIYTGGQPATADLAESGTLLCLITEASGAFTGGVNTNGLRFDDGADKQMAKTSAVWSGVGLADGVAGWFRFYANAYTTGASTTAVRFDGNVGASGAQLNMSNTNVVTGATTTIDTFYVEILN